MGIGVPLAVIDQQRPRSADNEFDREPKLVTAEPRTTVAGYPDKFRHAFVAFRHACDQTDYEDAGETAPGAREDACDHPSMPDGCRQERSRITFYLLYDKIYREDILRHAYDLMRANKGTPA